METNSFKDSFANEALLSPAVGVELLPTMAAFFRLSQRGTFTLVNEQPHLMSSAAAFSYRSWL